MPRELTISISTAITVLLAFLGGMGWIGAKFEDQSRELNQMQARILARISDIDIANAKQDARIDAQAERIELVNVRQSWLYGKMLGRDVSPGWPQAEGGQ